MSREKIIELLRRTTGTYLSGEDISSVLNISRAAVWKHISALRDDGYEIDSSPNVGYRLISEPDRLNGDEIELRLSPSSMFSGKVIWVKETGSTNEMAKDKAEKMCPEGTVIIADRQTQGKGRLSRSWYSPAGKGIWMSAVLRPPLSPVESSGLPIIAAVAVAESIQGICGVKAGIKWPNDIVIQGKKICGILTEIRAEMDQVHYAILGIGINANHRDTDFPPDIRDRATSIREVLGQRISRSDVACSVLEKLELNYKILLEAGFTAVKTKWMEHDVLKDKPISITQIARDQSVSGIAKGMAEDGSLEVLLPDGTSKYFYAGEVTLRQ